MTDLDEPSLGVLLFIPYRHMEQMILDALGDQGYTISLAQARMAQRIDPEGSRLTRLAQAAQITKATAGYLVDPRAEAGYVERGLDPGDARARVVRFTSRGHELIARARTVEHDIEAQWRSHLGDQRTMALIDALKDLRDITDPFLVKPPT